MASRFDVGDNDEQKISGVGSGDGAGRTARSIHTASSSSATGSTTPSKVLSDKFDELDRAWKHHKATSPIPIIRRRRRTGYITQEGSGSSSVAAAETTNNNTIITNHTEHDHDSIGSGSISTLSYASSTDRRLAREVEESGCSSVFDRLYRQGIRSPRRFQLPSGSQSQRQKNRLGAYQQGAVPATATAGDYDGWERKEKTTPRCRTTRPSSDSGNFHCHNDSDADTDCHGADDHYYFSTRLTQNFGGYKNIDRDSNMSPVPFGKVESTSFDQDLEAIIELGRQLGNVNDNEDILDNIMTSPTILTATSVSSATADDTTTTPSSTTLDDDVHALELLRKELDQMDANRGRQILASSSDHDDSIKSPVLLTGSRSKSSSSSKKPQSALLTNDTYHTDTTATDDSYGFFTLDQSSRSYFFAERVDRLSLPFRRRSRSHQAIGEDCGIVLQRPRASLLTSDQYQEGMASGRTSPQNCLDDRPLLTPRRLRTSACVSIQTCWRMHLAEIELTSNILSTWRTNVSIVGTYRQAPRHLRRAALYHAVKIVPCWWILEGFHAETNWVSLAWENEVTIGNTNILVQVTCDAKAPAALERVWTDRKLSILLVKATLLREFRGECAACMIARWYRRYRGKLHMNASIIQRWSILIRGRRDQFDKNSDSDHHFAPQTQAPEERPFTDIVDRDTHDIVTYTSTEKAAAVTIQNWFRVLVLKDALKNVPSTSHQLRSVLRVTGKPSTTFFASDDVHMTLIQDVLRNSSVGIRLTDWIENPVADPISRRAAALAIQNIVRAYLKGLVIYRRKKNATMIQKWVQGYLARRRIDEMHYAAVIIQFAWSNYRYLDYRKKHAIVVQKFWKRIFYQRQYQMSLFCIILVQSTWRRALKRRSFHNIVVAVKKIQSVWRGLRERLRYGSIRSAVVSVQYLFRKQKVLEQHYKDTSAAINLQSWWRMEQSRLLRSHSVNAAVLLQSITRRNAHFRCFQRIRASTIVVQNRWRTILARRFFAKSIRSAVVLQQNWRAYRERKIFVGVIYAATRIQSYWRTAITRLWFRTSIRSIVVTQSLVRQAIARKWFLKQQASIVLIQSAWRGVLGGRKAITLRLQTMNTSSILIQSWWRSKKAQIDYDMTLSNIIILQAVVRCLLARRYYDGLRLQEKFWTSAIKIQSQWRAMTGRQQFCMALKSTIKIQAAGRRILAGRIHSAMVLSQRKREWDSACAIQVTWRGRRARCSYVKALSSVVSLQTHLRGFLARSLLRKMKASKLSMKNFAAAVIQTQWRAAFCRDRYLFARNGAILLQARARSLLSSRRYQNLILEEQKRKAWESSLLQVYHESAIKVQSVWRMHYKRRLFLCVLSNLHESRMVEAGDRKGSNIVVSATTIQAQWRGSNARSFYSSARVACIVIQSFGRRLIAMKERDDLLRRELSAVRVQSRVRGLQSRQEYLLLRAFEAAKEQNAIIIQSLARRYIAQIRWRTQYNFSIGNADNDKGVIAVELPESRDIAATCIQAYWRRSRKLDQFTQLRVSAILIQAIFRKYLSKSRFSESIKAIHAAIEIQRHVRCYIAQENYHITRVYIAMIQSAWRGKLTRSQWRFLRYLAVQRDAMDAAARTIQVSFVLWKMENAIWEMKSLAVLLKRGMRGQLVRSSIFFALRRINSSIFPTIVTAYYRVVLSKHAVDPILAWSRAMSQARISACIVIQSYARRMYVRNQVRLSFGVMFGTSSTERNGSGEERSSAITIQHFFRSRLDAEQFSSTEIQRITRGWMARRSLHMRLIEQKMLLKTSAATKIQMIWKVHILRQILIKSVLAAIQIQSISRGYLARQLFFRCREAVLFLQRSVRDGKLQMLEKEITIARFSAAVQIQALVRGAQTRSFVSNLNRRYLAQSEAIHEKIIKRAYEVGAIHVEELFERQTRSSEICLSRLVERVQSAMELAVSERMKADRIAGLAAPNTEIPLPTKRHSIRSSSKTVSSTPVRSNKKDFTGLSTVGLVSLQVPLLASRNRSAEHANKLIEDVWKNTRQIDRELKTTGTPSTPAKRGSSQQSTSLPCHEAGYLDVSGPSFDVASPISKAETSGWDWTDS